MTSRLLAAAAIPLALALPACSSSGSSSTTSAVSSTTATTTTTTNTTALPGTGKPQVTVGDENYTEQFVLGELYYEALKAQGFSVLINQNIGPTAVRVQQLQSGTVNLYPEYLNVWNSQIAGKNRHFKTLRASYLAAQDFAFSHDMELLNPTPFSDTSGIGVTMTFAAQNHLRTIGNLANVASTLTVGGPPQFQSDATAGLPAMEAAYGFSPAGYKPFEIPGQYAALDSGAIQAAYVTTTDGELTTGNYRLLADSKKVFGIGNVVPVVSLKTLDEEGPAFAATINRVSALLTMSVIRELNSEVDPDLAGKSAAGVASRFLADHGLIPPSSVVS